jgi:hypothetical protein
MTETDFFLSPAPAEAVRYPLHMQQHHREDHDRLVHLAQEQGFRAQDWGWMAVEEVQRYRYAVQTYRQALVDLGALRELPVWPSL